MIRINRFNVSILTFFLLLNSALAYEENDVTEMSFIIQSNDISLKFPTSTDKTKVSSMEVTWWQKFSDSLQARLNIAYVEMSQNADASVLGYTASGYELGIGFRGNVITSDVVNIGLGVSFDYLAIDGETNIEEAIDITWFKYSGGIDFEFLPLSSVSILTGLNYTVIDGEHRVIDTANSLTTFSEDKPEGYYIGMSFKSGNSGTVNMTLHGGQREGIFLTFSNRF